MMRASRQERQIRLGKENTRKWWPCCQSSSLLGCSNLNLFFLCCPFISGASYRLEPCFWQEDISKYRSSGVADRDQMFCCPQPMLPLGEGLKKENRARERKGDRKERGRKRWKKEETEEEEETTEKWDERREGAETKMTLVAVHFSLLHSPVLIFRFSLPRFSSPAFFGFEGFHSLSFCRYSPTSKSSNQSK